MLLTLEKYRALWLIIILGYYSGFDEDSPGPEHAVWGMMPNLLQSPILSSLTTSRTWQVITTTIRSSWCLKMFNSYVRVGSRISTCYEEDETPIMTKAMHFVR